mmetsp:Transcript_11062/g.10725  ORF Transcript_11062/g.10725 Transcript_11062/m.10725 type:complete len:151 (-) Transcript_11062:989-1441(-)
MAIHKPEFLVLVPRVLEKIAAGVQDKFNGASASTPVKILSKLFTSTGRIRATNTKIANGLVVSSTQQKSDDEDDINDETPSAIRKVAATAIVKAFAPLNYVGEKVIWKKVQQGFGGKLKCSIAGGSALSNSLESFYDIAGICYRSLSAMA